jgi:hypothetical protein
MDALIVFVLLGGTLLGPLLLRIVMERREDRALRVRAVVHAAAVDALGGESLLAVHVRPPSLWRPGRVSLSTPADWECLIERAWPRVVALVPADYELVVKEAHRAGPLAHPAAVAVGRAA